MKLLKNKTLIIVLILVFITIFIYGLQQTIKVDKAHQTFENYYAFRGCINLVKKTTNYGLCKLSSGQVIKLVKFHEKWYLDGDLPTCFSNICF